MFNIPMYYDHANVVNSVIQPSTIHVHDTALARFFKRYLLMKAIAVFKWNLPESWDPAYFLYTIFCCGYIAVVNTNKFGVIPQHCTLSGYGVFYQPTEAVIANPLLRGFKRLKIGVQTELIKLNHDYGSILDLINFYGDLMALSAETAGTNLLNCKLAYLFAAASKGEAESFKKIYDLVASGEPVAVYDKSLLDENGKLNLQFFNQNLKNTYIVSDVLADLRKWEEMFLTAIGIPNANTDKRERLITDEVNANNVETQTLADEWLENLQRGCEKVNKMFNLNISVQFRFTPDQAKQAESEVYNDEGNTESTRNL